MACTIVYILDWQVHHMESFKQSRQIQVQKNGVRRLHAIFRSKVAGSPRGGVTTGIRAVCSMGYKVERLALRRNWKVNNWKSS